MGCTHSKVDDLPAVKLCRERCNFLDEAIRRRYLLSEAHFAYMESLHSIGFTLSNFWINTQTPTLNHHLNSPIHHHHPIHHNHPIHNHSNHSHSNSGSHLQFDSDSEDHLHHHPDVVDDDDNNSSIGSLHHEEAAAEAHHHHQPNSNNNMNYYAPLSHDADYGITQFPTSTTYGGGGGGGGFMSMNYMKKSQAMPSVSYEMSPTQTFHTSSSSSSYYQPYHPSNHLPPTGAGGGGVGYSVHNNNANSNSNYNYNYNSNYNYGGAAAAGGGGGGYFGAPPPSYDHPEASSSKPPPPMPSPERASAWDIFNPFDYDKYYSPYTPSREVRAAEGIPDLEEEDVDAVRGGYRHPQVVKEVYEDRNTFLHHSKMKKKLLHDDHNNIQVTKNTDHENLYRTRPSVSLEDDEGMEYDVHVVDKKIDKSQDHANFKARKGSVAVSEVLKEIQLQFERASESGNELSVMLEVGKLQYNRKHGSAYQVSSKMLNVISPSQSVVSSQPFTSSIAESSSSASNANSTLLGFEEETGIKLKNLSSTLQKLYLWEKKLYHEVKAEEKMRVVHDRKCQKLKRLDEKGAEAHKAEITRTLIRSLATKIKIAIQVVDKISVNINKMRDEELWPLLYELIQGLARMWKSMLECHRAQCQAIKEAKGLDAIASHKRPNDAQLEATMQLEHELIGWTLRFSNWVEAQKGYITSLNNWLLKCLHVEPEETPDGIAPFSPGRIGAPPVFVICNQWAQALERISEREVVDSMRLFASTVLQFWERDKLIVRQSMTANKDFDKRVKTLDREDHKMQKQIQALEKRVVMISGDANSISEQSVYQSDTSSVNSLQASLQHILEAMERFTATSTKAYEEILQRNEEDNRIARERENANNVS